MKVGKMRYRITFKENIPWQDDEGFEQSQLAEVCTVWADIVPLSGTEYISSNREITSVTNKIYIRYRPGLTTKMEIYLDDYRRFKIESILGDKRSGYLTIMAVEVS